MAYGNGVAKVRNNITVDFNSFFDELTEFLGDLASEYVTDEFRPCESDDFADYKAYLIAYEDMEYRSEYYEQTLESPSEFTTSIDDEVDIEPTGEQFAKYLLNKTDFISFVKFIEKYAKKIKFEAETEIEY